MIKHYRGDSFIQNIEPVSAQLKRGLMGPFLLEFELPDVSDIYVGDSVQLEWNDETLTFIIREINERTITAEHKSYILRNYAVVDKYLNDPPTYDSLIEFADISLDEVITFLNPLFADAGFSISNSSVSSERKDITFNGDNLLSAIQKVCNTFKVEFVSHDGYIQIVDQYGIDTGLTINAGIHTESIKKRIDRSNIITRIYPIGSSENLPEGYYYTALRPTTFDLSTKTHTGNLYVDNTEAQQDYGIIEKVVEFSHVKLKSKRGTVTSVGSDAVSELGNKEYPYIHDASMNIPDPDKAKSATLYVKNGLKAAELPIVHIDVGNKRIYYNPTLKDGTTLSWTPAIGSEYILVGYISQAEMDAARDELIAEAQRYLEENAGPKVSYEISDLYLPDEIVFDVGDSLHLKDDSAGIDTTVRVLEFAYDLIKGMYQSLKLSNTIEKLPYDILREQAEQKRQIEQIKLQVSESWQTARDALERHNLLVRTNFYGSENEYLLIGSTARNYVLKGLTITPDDGTPGKVSWTNFSFQHINETTEYTCGSGNQQLSVGTYYLYIQIKLSDPANASGMNKLIFSSTPLENSGELNYYALGMAEFDGTRTKVATSYGFTLIDGNFIKTGTIQADKITTGILQGSSGTTKFDLDNDIIDVGTGTVKLGKDATPKYYETCEIYVDILSNVGSLIPIVFASLDGVTWINLGSTQNLNRQMTKVGLFSLQKEGTTLYLKVKTTGLDGEESGNINLYVDGALFTTFYYNVRVGETEEQIFSYTLPSSPSDGISISGGLLETPQIVLSNTAGKILFADSYWEITDGQVLFATYTELTMNFTNKYFDDKIIFFDLDNYVAGIRGFGLRFDFGDDTIGEIFNNDDLVSIGKYNKITGDGPYISLYSNAYVRISGNGLVIPSLSTAPSPISGMIYFNSADGHFYGYNGSTWVRLD